ncbi:MAG: hypothetical protein RLZZ443_964 [Actinomycetota bacterium]|jgi:hypothetical protein
MTVLLYQFELWVCLAASLVPLVLAAMKRLPSLVSIGALAVVELMLIVQLVAAIVLVIGGARAKGDTVEFFGYLITALLVPLATGFWALLERTRWSTLILGIGGLTVAVMLVRMYQIWFGSYF